MPHRVPLLDLLKKYIPDDESQRSIKQSICDFILGNEDCFLRSNLAGHITASCFLLSPDKKDVLLTHHKKIGSWLQLGGHADGDHDVLRVSIREAEEESGITNITALDKNIFDVDIHHIAQHKDVPPHLHLDVRFLLLAPQKNFYLSEESHALAWIPTKNLFDSNNVSLQRMAKKWHKFIDEKLF